MTARRREANEETQRKKCQCANILIDEFCLKWERPIPVSFNVSFIRITVFITKFLNKIHYLLCLLLLFCLAISSFSAFVVFLSFVHSERFQQCFVYIECVYDETLLHFICFTTVLSHVVYSQSFTAVPYARIPAHQYSVNKGKCYIFCFQFKMYIQTERNSCT